MILYRLCFILSISLYTLSANSLKSIFSGIALYKSDVKQSRVAFIRGGSSVTASEFVPELKPPSLMYNGAVAIGALKSVQPAIKTLLLGILGGCHIAFGAFLTLAVGGACPDIAAKNPGLQKIIQGAFGLPFGLMMVLIGGAELFTGNTALLTTAVVEGKSSAKGLLKNWFFSYIGNFLGSLLMAALVHAGGTLGSGPASVAVAIGKTSLTFSQAFVRGILCNWLVCMAVYMASGASSVSGKMIAIWFPISSFIALGLDHSVANMFLIPLGMLRGAEVSFSDFLLKNLLPVTLGNIVGGAGCVGLMYSAIYGTLLSKPKSISSSPSPTKIPSASPTSIPASVIPQQSVITGLRGGSVLPNTANKRLGSDYLPPATLARATEGNMFEKLKIKKDGTNAWTDVHEFAAAIRAGNMTWEDIMQDDMDIRLKWSGLFHRKRATPGKFMMRLRIPNGIINSDHMRFFADSVRPYGPEIGVVDITTRQNIQLRGMGVEGGSDVIKGLQARNLTSLMSGLDNVRNMVGSPIAGIDPFEIFDTRQLTKQLDDWYSGNGYGNPEWGNLPRKFNIAVSGSRDDFAHTNINDIGLRPVQHAVTTEVGFNVVLGGYFSLKRVAESIPANIWIPQSAALPFCKAVLRLFRDEGARGDRQKTRLMWLIEDWGLEKFLDEVRKEMSVYDDSWKDIASFEVAQPFLSEWTQGHREVIGVHDQKQEGKVWVGIHVPVGRLSADECVQIAELADKYSQSEVRLTVDQNIILPNVDKGMVEQLLQEPSINGNSRMSVYPGNIAGRVISCTGSQFCPVALIETKLPIVALTEKLEKMLVVPHPVRIHMTGCPNSCGQVQVADIGLMGAPAKKADAEGKMKAVPGVNIFVGGRIGEDAFLSLEPVYKGIPMNDDDILPLLANILIERHGAVRR